MQKNRNNDHLFSIILQKNVILVKAEKQGFIAKLKNSVEDFLL